MIFNLVPIVWVRFGKMTQSEGVVQLEAERQFNSLGKGRGKSNTIHIHTCTPPRKQDTLAYLSINT